MRGGRAQPPSCSLPPSASGQFMSSSPQFYINMPPLNFNTFTFIHDASAHPNVQGGALSKGSTPDRALGPLTIQQGPLCAPPPPPQRTRLEQRSSIDFSKTWAPGYYVGRPGPSKATVAAASAALGVGAETTPALRGLKAHSHSMAPFQRVSVSTRGLLISHSL